jgi:sarcosine oxidase subunit gamma
MAEHDQQIALQRRPPIAEIVRPDLMLTMENAIGIAKLQLLEDRMDHDVAHVVGIPAPSTGTQVEADGLTVAWLAPGEWLLLGAEDLVAARLPEIDARSGGTALIVDVTHARVSFLLTGANARGALAAHCPLDFWPAAFPVNTVARTLLGDTGMFIARLKDTADGPCFRVIVDQTMGTYAARMIAGPSMHPGARP